MKSGLLSRLNDIKLKNISLRNEVENDYKNYCMTSKIMNAAKITITETEIVIEDNGDIINFEYSNINSLMSFLHIYLAKSMIKRTNANRYDVYVFDDINSQYCKKLGFLEESQKTTDKRCVVVCTNKDLASIFREELVAVYKYIVIYEPFEKMLSLWGN